MNNRILPFRNLSVWQKSIQLVTKVYKVSNLMPKQEQYGLSNQMRRAAVSIPSNIAEGSKRTTKKEFKYFLNIALGSSAELETQIEIAANLKYIVEQNKNNLIIDLSEIQKMIFGLIRTLDESSNDKMSI